MSDRIREIVVREAGGGMAILSYLAKNYEKMADGKFEWKEVEISRAEFTQLLKESEYRDKMIPSAVFQQWVAENSAPNFLRQGDWFVTTLLEDPMTSMWCLHGNIFIASVGPLPNNVAISQTLQTALAYA